MVGLWGGRLHCVYSQESENRQQDKKKKSQRSPSDAPVPPVTLGPQDSTDFQNSTSIRVSSVHNSPQQGHFTFKPPHYLTYILFGDVLGIALPSPHTYLMWRPWTLGDWRGNPLWHRSILCWSVFALSLCEVIQLSNSSHNCFNKETTLVLFVNSTC